MISVNEKKKLNFTGSSKNLSHQGTLAISFCTKFSQQKVPFYTFKVLFRFFLGGGREVLSEVDSRRFPFNALKYAKNFQENTLETVEMETG